MSDEKAVEHTKGPWRWEVRPKEKMVVLEAAKGGGTTVMDFVRWGMGSAAPRFRDHSDLGLMSRVEAFAIPEPGRLHHAHWHRIIDHPDARLIAAAPDLCVACEKAEGLLPSLGGAKHGYPLTESEIEAICEARSVLLAAIAKARGVAHV